MQQSGEQPAAAATAPNAEEIELPDEEEDGAGPAAAAAPAAAAGGTGATLGGAAGGARRGLSAQTVLATAAAAERMVRGEPRSWDEMSEAEQEEGEGGPGAPCLPRNCQAVGGGVGAMFERATCTACCACHCVLARGELEGMAGRD